MMSAAQIWALTLFAIIGGITPGPNNMMVLASGTNFGVRRTIPHILGVSLGFAAMILLMAAGLQQIFALIPGFHTVLKVVSVAYMVWLAWKIATSAPPSAEASSGKPMTALQAAMFQWVNPKAWSLALTSLAIYLPAHPSWLGIVTLIAIVALISIPSLWLWTAMGTQMTRWLTSPGRLRAFNWTAAFALLLCIYPIVIH